MESSSSHRWVYDVFVSFRGEDIRKGFMDHLFTDFNQKGIHAFRDDELLNRGEEISSELYNAIQESRFLIAIFSSNYASSRWCLRELVKIMDCKEMHKDRYEVMPIFYDVKPEVVRHQRGTYADAFGKHEASNQMEVHEWKEALTKAANLSGWDLQDMANGYDSKFIDMISKHIFYKLSHGPLHVGENLVGLPSCAGKMNLLQFIGSSKVHMIGICGIGGIGKTTMAKAIYNLMYTHFEGCCFCEDVKEVSRQHGLVHLQKQILDEVMKAKDLKIQSVSEGISVMKRRMGCKKVLIVLDNVDRYNQLDALAGARYWFGSGSVIVVTSKDVQLLRGHGMEVIYGVDYLYDDEALELFSLYAYRRKRPREDFVRVADEVVQYVKGHPLTLKVLGCFMFGKTVKECKSELEKLGRIPNAEIQQVLKLSYDGLDSCQKTIFLDIACFFRKRKKEYVSLILDGCGLFPDTNIRVLIDKSLITISKDRIHMHDLLQRMGWGIVQEESQEPGRRSRLWIPEDVCHVLNHNKGTATVRGLSLDLLNSEVHIKRLSFEQLSNLQLLNLHYGMNESPKDIENLKCQFNLWENHTKVAKIEFISNELRWLCWHGYPYKLFPSTFYPESLVALDMSYSHIRELWAGCKGFKKLKLMNLSYCHNLTKTPDFTQVPNLDKLILEGCKNLVELHPSIGNLKRLTVLNLKKCENIVNLPSSTELQSLQVLNLSGCSKVEKLPENLGNIKTLMKLLVDGTLISELPSSLLSHNHLQTLSVGGSAGIPSRSWSSVFWPSFILRKWQHPMALALPSFSGLRLLRELNVSRCNLSGASFTDLPLLEYLDVSHCGISEENLHQITSLSLLEELNLSGNSFTSMPANFRKLSRLIILGLVGCKNLEALPELPSSIVSIDAQDCTSLQTLSKQSTLLENSGLEFNFSNCPKLVENHPVECLANMLLMQGRIDPYRGLDMCFPGSTIPAWFTNQNIGNSVRLDLPPQWDYLKFKGIATCAILTLEQPYDFKIQIHSVDDVLILGLGIAMHQLRNEPRCQQSDQIWLHFNGVKYGWEEAKDYIVVTFGTFRADNVKTVKKCGVRLLYDDEEQEECDSKMIQWLTPCDADVSVSPNVDDHVAFEEERPPKRPRMVGGIGNA